MKIAVFLLTSFFAIATGQGVANADDDEHEYRVPHAKFYGTIESMPQRGFLGTWVVNEREIAVDENTEIEQEHGAAELGSYVQVEGSFFGSKFLVEEISVKRGGRHKQFEKTTYNCKFSGTIEQMPKNGHEGSWMVAGRAIEVGASTMIDESASKAAEGCTALVKGVRAGSLVKAMEISIASKCNP